MVGRDRTDPTATPPQPPDEARAGMDDKSMAPETGEGQDPRRRPARADPETGEVRAGPGDAGLQDRPTVNPGTPGTKQMSNRRLGIGLGIAAILAIITFILAAVF